MQSYRERGMSKGGALRPFSVTYGFASSGRCLDVTGWSAAPNIACTLGAAYAEETLMTKRLGTVVAALSILAAANGAAFAQDSMSKHDSMKKHDAMDKQDAMKKDGSMMKHGAMSKHDSMSKHDAMEK